VVEVEENANGNVHTTPVFSPEFTVPARQKQVQEIQTGDVCCRVPSALNAGRVGCRNLVPFGVDVLIDLNVPARPSLKEGKMVFLP